MRYIAWMAVLPLLVPLAGAPCAPGATPWDRACCTGGCACPGDCSMTCDEPPTDLVAVPPEATPPVATFDQAPVLSHDAYTCPPATPLPNTVGPVARDRALFLLDCALLL